MTSEFIWPPLEVRTETGSDSVEVSAVQRSPRGYIFTYEKIVRVRRPNPFERLLGITFETKIRRAIQTMKRHVDAKNAETESLGALVNRILQEETACK